jgi:PIN domain nuclease of toxin-antitoxin system
MRLLLDTQTFLWFSEGSQNLSIAARTVIEDPEHERYLSIASIWELAIKMRIGKLTLPLPFDDTIERYMERCVTNALPIGLKHLAIVSKLPLHHRDPFDRLIIAQAIVEEMIIVTSDGVFADYEIGLVR